MTLQALIFDVDGTLADTERDGHRIAFNAAFAEAGMSWNWDAALYGELLAVTGGKERMRFYCEHHDPDFLEQADADERIKALHAAKTRHYVKLLEAGGIPLQPGVTRLLREAHAAGLRLAIATTTTPENVTALMPPDLMKLFEKVGAGDTVAKKKPAPDIYDWVLDELGLPPSACLAFEDSANGLKASLAAGLPTLVTESEYTLDHDFSGAFAVLSDLGEPSKPCQVRRGDMHGKAFVDVELLKTWHRETISNT
ncbi:MAG: HAD family hydrolase [Gammaproteobacteria bacterium]|nr:HAD family hydrolase [Gammaproteobacteria bacterium]MBU1644852.1 HAD family hydrolase [Gammaproteobacteria bacterium]MBU1973085.1 HAD family hydrolase [Gammaproteobacteria bacterium]